MGLSHNDSASFFVYAASPYISSAKILVLQILYSFTDKTLKTVIAAR
ncbi:hypothetical protein TFUB22_00822 [Tannerella forsythia]|nr:hypothetical protein TFUB22_00822 [Tannerella forsythia]